MTYRVAWGIGECNEHHCDTWPEALAFARERRATWSREGSNPYWSISIYNDDLSDSSDDSTNVTGLTDEQREEWEE